MTTAEKLVKVAENVPKVYKAGQKSEYNSLWDAYQQNGSRTDYAYAFAGVGWNNETFKPKYNIKPYGRCPNMFYDSSIEGDLVQILKNLGITLDLSETTRFGYGFYYSTELIRIGEINLSKAIDATTYVFADCRILETIDKLTVSENNTFSNWFYNCDALKEIRFEGVIGKSLDIHWSTKLSTDSLRSIIEHLGGSASATLTLPSKFNTTEYADIIASKPSNWTIAYL